MNFSFKKLLLTGTALVAVSVIPLHQSLAANGADGATGASVDGSATTSTGATSGTAGAVATDPGTSGTGGDGIRLITGGGGTATFTGAIAGGAGGAAVAAGGGVTTDIGGSGGRGLWFNGQSGADASHLTAISNGISIVGGAGQAGAAGNAGAGSAGGNGGIGILDDANFTKISGAGTVTGGAAGAGGAGAGGNNNGANAGTAGDAIKVTGNTSTINNTGNVTGGAGAAGGQAAGTGTGGNGSAGGIGYNITGNSSTITITGNATGGAGGLGGSAVGAGTGGDGGAGGAAVVLGGTSTTVTIKSTSTITGGKGTSAVTPGGGTPGAAGAAGDGITVSGATGQSITNAGTIVGGADGANVAGAGIAINVTGTTGTSSITNQTGATIGGTGAGDGLKLASGKTLVTVTNAGTIQTGTGTALNISAGAAGIGTLNNTGGTIKATGAGIGLKIAGTGGVGTLTNTGGTISSAGLTTNAALSLGADVGNLTIVGGTISNTSLNNTGWAIDITAAQTGTLTIDSAATISSIGAGSTSAPTGTAVNFTAAGKFNNNGGTVLGNIRDGGVASAITVTNSGTMKGNINLTGAAQHDILLTGGTLTGTITGASGVDNLTLGSTSVSGAIDLSTGANTLTVTGGTFTTSNTITSGAAMATSVASSGTFNVGHNYTASTGTLSVANGGTLNITAGTFGNTGAFTSAGTTTVSGSAAATFGAITNSGTFTTSSSALTNSGAITNTGTIKALSGNLTSSGAFANNAGSTLIINPNRTVTAASGAVAGANNWTFGVTDSTHFGQFVTTGATVWNGTTAVTIDTSTATSLLADGTKIKIVDGGATSTLGVAAATLATDNSALMNFKLYRGDDGAIGLSDNDLYALVVRAATTTLSTGGNNTTVAGILDSGAVQAAGGNLALIQGALGAATSAAAVNEIIEATQPTMDGSAMAGSLGFSGHVSSLADTRMASLRTGETGMAAGSAANGMGFWLEGFGQHAEQDRRSGIDGYDSDTYGGAFGVDSANILNNAVVGVAVSYGVTNADSNNANTTSTDIDSYGINIYGSTNVAEGTFVNGQLGYAFNTIDSDRHNVGGVAGVTANADYNSNQFSAKALVGREYPGGDGMTVTPSLSAAYTHLNTQSYTETGAGGANLHVESDSVNAFDLGVGVDVGWNFKASNDGSMLKPSLHAGYTYDLIGDNMQTTANFTGAGAAFRTEGFDPARSKADVGAKIVMETMQNWDLSAAYDYEIKSEYDAHSGWLRATSRF